MQYFKIGNASVLRGAIRDDIYKVLSAFFSQENLSFSAFKACWQKCKTSLLHHACPAHIDYNSFLQMCFEVLQALLFQPPPEYLPETHATHFKSLLKGEYAVLPLAQSAHSFPKLWLLQELPTRTIVWNIGIVYTLYCLHGTQPGPSQILRRDGNPTVPPWAPLPVRVTPSGLTALLLAAEQCRAIGELGHATYKIITKMHHNNSFLHALYTGPPGLWSVKRHVLHLRDGLRRAEAEAAWLDNFDISNTLRPDEHMNVDESNSNEANYQGGSSSGPLANSFPVFDFALPLTVLLRRAEYHPGSIPEVRVEHSGITRGHSKITSIFTNIDNSAIEIGRCESTIRSVFSMRDIRLQNCSIASGPSAAPEQIPLYLQAGMEPTAIPNDTASDTFKADHEVASQQSARPSRRSKRSDIHSIAARSGLLLGLEQSQAIGQMGVKAADNSKVIHTEPMSRLTNVMKTAAIEECTSSGDHTQGSTTLTDVLHHSVGTHLSLHEHNQKRFDSEAVAKLGIQRSKREDRRAALVAHMQQLDSTEGNSHPHEQGHESNMGKEETNTFGDYILSFANDLEDTIKNQNLSSLATEAGPTQDSHSEQPSDMLSAASRQSSHPQKRHHSSATSLEAAHNAFHALPYIPIPREQKNKRNKEPLPMPFNQALQLLQEEQEQLYGITASASTSTPNAPDHSSSQSEIAAKRRKKAIQS